MKLFNLIHILCSIGKKASGTPKRDIKSGTPSRDSKQRAPKIESRKEKLLKWRQERDMRRKLDVEEKAKKQPFRVCHVEHSDKEVFKKDKQVCPNCPHIVV